MFSQSTAAPVSQRYCVIPLNSLAGNRRTGVMFHTQSAETDNRLHGRTGKGNDMLLSGGHKGGCTGDCGKGGGDAPVLS